MAHEASDRREVALREEAIPKLVMRMSAPAIMAMVVMSLYNLADAIFMGMLGTEALGAATVGYPYFIILTAIGLMFGMGGASYQSRLLGERNRDRAEKAVATVFVSGAILGVVTTLVTTPLSSTIAVLFGANDQLLEPSTLYIRVLSIGAVFPILSMCANNLLRAEGSAVHSLLGMGLSSILNIILDPILMFTFDLGVMGAALATVISQAVGTLILFSFYFRRKTLVSFHPRQFTPDALMYREILIVGGAAFIQQVLVTVTMAFTNQAAVRLGGATAGDSLVAAAGVINRLSMLGYTIMMGFGQGLQPVIGYNYGARQYPRVRQAITFAFLVTGLFGILLSGISLIFPEQLARWFSSDQAVIGPAVTGIRFLAASWPVSGFFFVTLVLFQALGRPRPAITLTAARQLLTLLCIWGLSSIFGVPGLMGSMSAGILLSFTVAVTLYVPYHRELSAILRSSAGD